MTTRERFAVSLRFWLFGVGAFYIGGTVAWNHKLAAWQDGSVGQGLLLLEAGGGVLWLLGAVLLSLVSTFLLAYFPKVSIRIPLLLVVIVSLLLGLAVGTVTFNPSQAEFL